MPIGAAPIEAAVAMTAVATSAGTTEVAVAGAASAEAAAAAAARAAKVYLLRLPSGRPRLRDTGGVTTGSFTLSLLPSRRPRLRPLDSPSPKAPVPPGAPVDDMVEARANWRGEMSHPKILECEK
jgi:hypothetical protein